MHVEDRRVLPGALDVAEGFPQRVEQLAVVAIGRVAHPQMKVERRRDGGCNWKHAGVSVGQSQRALAPHADSEQRDARRLDAEASADFGDDSVADEPLGCHATVERGHDPVEPP